MTPLHLEILFHYYTRANDYELVYENETRRKYAYDLAKEGCLYTPDASNKIFEITAYGKVVCEKILENASSLKPEAK